jgi:O-methyltransferase involved in polyketide biosynthesis
LGDALDGAGFDRSIPATWIWEGVLPYLTDEQVHATLAEVQKCSAPGAQLIATYSTKLALNRVGQFALKVLFGVAGRRNPMASEPHVSAWSVEQLGAMLGEHGMTVTSDVDQLALARDLDISPKHPDQHERSRVIVARS